MAIYNIFEHVEKCVGQDEDNTTHIELDRRYSNLALGGSLPQDPPATNGHFFSSLAARLFFFMLLVVDIAWSIYTTSLFGIALVLNCVTGFQFTALCRFYRSRYLNFKRSFVCGVALFVALFSPALGTMFACTYFLMYDKKGIEEVVPSVLQDQFRDFFTH